VAGTQDPSCSTVQHSSSSSSSIVSSSVRTQRAGN
jgi:hypothetical protein